MHDGRGTLLVTRDELLARVCANTDEVLLDRGALPQQYRRVPLPDASMFALDEGLSGDNSYVWVPDDDIAEHVRCVSIRRHGQADTRDCELFFFSIPASPVTILLGGSGHEVMFLSKAPFAAQISLFRPSTVTIGQGATSGGARIIAGNSDVVVGKDCLLSDEILLQSTDQHGVLDLTSGALLNGARSHITLERHVWVGRRVTITKNVTVGGGSIAAAGAVVTKSVPPLTAVGGNPAAPIRSGVSWSRLPHVVSQRDRKMLAEIEARTAESDGALQKDVTVALR